MARLNKADKTKLLEEITSSHDFLRGFVDADEPTQYPQPGAHVGTHGLYLHERNVQHKLASETGIEDANALSTLSRGQFLRAKAHELLGNRFPVSEEDAPHEYDDLKYARQNAFHGIREGLSRFHLGLFSYLGDQGADRQTLRTLDAQPKPNTHYVRLRTKGHDPNEARAIINERLPHINTSYPTIDDVEALWSDLKVGVIALQSDKGNSELAQKVANAGVEYMDTMRRLHDFNKY